MHVYLTKAWCRLFYLDRKKICRDTSVCAQAGNNRWRLIKGIAQVLRPLCQAWRALLYLLPGWAPSRSLCQYNNHSTCCTEKYRTVWLVTMVIKKKKKYKYNSHAHQIIRWYHAHRGHSCTLLWCDVPRFVPSLLIQHERTFNSSSRSILYVRACAFNCVFSLRNPEQCDVTCYIAGCLTNKIRCR